MSPQVAKRVVAVGVVSCGVLWIFLSGSTLAFREGLTLAEASVQGDLPGVTAAVRRALQLARIGALFGLLGYILLFVGVLQGRARAPWIYRCGLAVAVSYLVLIPFGTILGVCGIIHFRRRRSEYFASSGQVRSPQAV